MKKITLKDKKQTIAVSGGFDPVHSGHISMFKEAHEYGDVLVLLNSDDFLLAKKGKIFMTFEERKIVLESIKYISQVVKVIDNDMTVCETLKMYAPDFFANGGDRKMHNTPETEVCDKYGIRMIFNVGGGKTQSSSDLLRAWEQNS